VKVEPVDLSTNPSEAVAELMADVDQARADELDILSPTWFQRAFESAVEANALLRDGAGLRDILEVTARGQAELAEARTYAGIAREEIKVAFDARAAAMSAGAPGLYEKEFEDVDADFLSLGRSIESGNTGDARRRSERVADTFRSLELRAIKEKTLGEARRLIAEAQDKNARKYAPRSLKDAQDTLAATDLFITRNPYSTEIQERADDVLRKAQHIHVVIDQVRAWSELSVEDRILFVEGNIVAIQTTAIGPEAAKRVQPLEKHFESAAEAVKAMRESQQFLNAELIERQAQLDELTRAQEKSEAQEAFAAKFERVRLMFNPDEAQVYRQGDRLLIRLIGMNFAVGQAFIIPEHYPLLTKVQNAIRAFDTRRMIIEGHTDLTGSAAINRQLSYNRANAVAAYLINNGAIMSSDVSVVGFGPEKPIAPNNTAEGRRLNRRIDVILIPGT
jgi:outer membrane protein OmpA-like peptidoglycan-associated protein